MPCGKVGRDFIDQVALHINDWNSSSDNQYISLKAAFVFLAVGLQKLSPKSKAKDHQDILSKRLILWRQGEINKLLREGRIVQGRIGKLKASEPPDRSKVFAISLYWKAKSTQRCVSSVKQLVVACWL